MLTLGSRKLVEVVGAAGLGADAAHAVAAEGLAADDRAGDVAVEVDVAGPQLGGRPLEVHRRAREAPGGEGVVGAVGQLDGVVEVAGPQHGEHRAEDLLAWRSARAGSSTSTMVGPTNQPVSGTSSRASSTRPCDGRRLDVAAHARRGRRRRSPGPPARPAVAGWPTSSSAAAAHQPGDDRVVGAVEHDQPRGGRALLAGVAEGRVGRGRHGLVGVGVVVDDRARSCRRARTRPS